MIVLTGMINFDLLAVIVRKSRLLICNIQPTQTCCQKATTKHKHQFKKFCYACLNWEFLAICKVCWRQSDSDYLQGLLQKCITTVCMTVMLWSHALAQAPRLNSHVSANKSIIRYDSEDQKLHWKPGTSQIRELIKFHRCIDFDAHHGAHCEQFILNAPQYTENQRLELALPPSRLFEELRVNLWLRSSCPEVRLSLRLQFPHQVDPRTGQQLTLDLLGDRYTKHGEWQRLTVATDEQSLKSRLKLAHALFSSRGNPIEIDTREVFVDQMSLLVNVREGQTALQIDDVEYGPIVSPDSKVIEYQPARTARTRLKVIDDRIFKDDKPFFPVFTLYHGESLNEVRSTGVNTLWIPDYADRPLLQALSELDIGAFAQPPQLTPEEAVLNKAGLPAFEDWTEPIWAWMFGFEVPNDDLRYLASWSEQVRASDQHLRRPLMADVVGDERAFHRKVDFLGSSQFVINSDISMPRHAKQLKHRRNLALPGKPMFTFVQTEAAAAYLDNRTEEETLPIVEPEQILHQGYAAIAAGYKGVGFWKQIPFNTELPGLNERMHAIRLFALHCEVLQPFLATGRVVDDLPVRIDSGEQQIQTGLLGPLKSRWDTPIEQVNAVRSNRESEVLATVIRCDDGILILPVWYEENEQCVPGPQAAQGIRLLLKGDIWQAWEVTPVGVTQSNLEVSWPAGGTEIHLKDFDQQSAIIITDRPDVIARLQRDCRRVRSDAAAAMVRLAGLKFTRVRDVSEQLKQLNASSSYADLFLKQAYSYWENAQRELEAEHPVEAYAAAQKSLQYLRMLQRQSWEAANRDLPSVVSSLPASGFQTLPDHWQTLQELAERSHTSPNLIPSGNFEETEQILKIWSNESTADGKKIIQRQQDSIRNDYHLTLSLESQPGEQARISLVSPPVETFAGDLIVITAKVRVRKPFVGPEDGFLIFDTVVGSKGAVRCIEPKSTWETVKIIRKISHSNRLQVKLELRGNGTVDIDDLRVHRLLP